MTQIEFTVISNIINEELGDIPRGSDVEGIYKNLPKNIRKDINILGILDVNIQNKIHNFIFG